MRIINVKRTVSGQKQLQRFMKSLHDRASFDGTQGSTRDVVEKIVRDVRKQGNGAVKRYSKREIDASAKKAGKEFIKTLRLSARRIRAFHELQKEESWYFSEKKGILLGQLIRPVERVGVYVPGGTASYPSTVLMNVIPAQVAGVKEIALCVPASGTIDSQVAAAIQLLGIREVYRIGGAQAVAAMAYGTETIKKVDKIVGPGNIYVATAKKMVFGEVGIDMFAGPSEILIIADRSARPSFVAADLLSQAEHDELASSICVTNSEVLAREVVGEVGRQLSKLRRKGIAKRSLDRYGAVIITRSLTAAVDVANQVAPEHLEIMTRTPARFLPRIRNAGAVFMGEWSPETLGDYAAGPNHTLPTNGTARFSSPLGVYDFIKRTSLINFRKEGFLSLSGPVEHFADIEGLEAHGNSVRIRTR
jgi:histidinol dehydrogenase